MLRFYNYNTDQNDCDSHIDIDIIYVNRKSSIVHWYGT